MEKIAVFELSKTTYDYDGAAGHALDSVDLVINQGDSASLDPKTKGWVIDFIISLAGKRENNYSCHP